MVGLFVTEGTSNVRFSLKAETAMVLPAMLFVAGCAVGPKYERPMSETPAEWRFKKAEAAQTVTGNKPATEMGAAFGPEVASVPQNWWTIFNDAKLNELAEQALDANQDIKLALGRVDEARALARLKKADFFPAISFSPGYSRVKDSDNAGRSANFGGFEQKAFNSYSLPFQLSYEVDVWGRIRKGREAAKDRAEATVADYYAVRLSIASDTAANYILLRALDSEVEVLRNSLKLRGDSLQLVETRFKLGATDALDVARAKADVAATEATLADTLRQRETVVNVISLLLGKPAPSVTFDSRPLDTPPPVIPSGLPSDLLQRRPDIFRAERQLAASSEEIGVAKAAFFPRFALTANGGFESSELDTLVKGSSLVWNLVANLAQPLFTGGRNKAELEAAKARYQQALAVYQQQVLVAFKDVQDALVDIRFRADQAKALDVAVLQAREVTRLAKLRYEKGQISYLDVLDAQRQQLDVEQQSARVLGQRLASTIRLVKALGGGWAEPAKPETVVEQVTGKKL